MNKQQKQENIESIPEWLVYLQDEILENTNIKEDVRVQFAEAIVPRENWKTVMHAIHYRILNEIALPVAGASADAVKQVMALHDRQETNAAAWVAVESAADAAERSAISAAAWSAAASADAAAWSASWSAAARSAAAAAAWTAAESVSAWSAAESAAWTAAESVSAWASAWSAAESAWAAAWKTILKIVLEEISVEEKDA